MTGTVMIATGGSGGHAFPGLAVAARLLAKGWHVFWLGTRDGIESRLVPQHGIDYESIRFAGVRGKGFKRLLLGPFALLSAFWQSLGIIRRRSPDVVLGLGGFVSFPGALMAVACNRPLLIHDANAVAGLANRILAYGADRILLGFPGALGNKHAGKVEWVGNPLRAEIVAVPPPEQRFARRYGTLSLLVVGGSLGATALNERVPAALALLDRDSRPNVVHQAGGRRGGLPAFHRRHRTPVRRCGSRHLPWRRIDDFRARRGRRRQRDRAAARSIRQRAIAQRAIPGRRRRGGHGQAVGNDRAGSGRPVACDESRPFARDGDR